MTTSARSHVARALVCLALLPQPALAGPRLAVFDCGTIVFESIANFGLAENETPVRELFVPCYLVQHERGTLFWDGGLALDLASRGWVEPEPGMKLRYDRSVLEQLAAMGFPAAEIDYVAFSHMHFDHVGAANAFAASTLLIQRTEHRAAFAEAERYPGLFETGLYEKLRGAKTALLDGDHDVFGDGSVEILSAPGHTPGHQVLYVDLAKTGPVVLSGDLYHFEESRALRRVPVFNTDAEATLRAMDRIEGIVQQRGATLWIEHVKALADRLRKAPYFHE
jgi:glyoxylase-like metal-dependent hydrolase (beta-lactamase superfamily II)